MSLEIFNTSAPRGVMPGTAGFCAVAMTVGISPALQERLTLLSGYRAPAEAGAKTNPVAWAHWRVPIGGRTLSVLSRVCDAGVDYSGRSNRFAHHVTLDQSELTDAGPAWIMRHGQLLKSTWGGEPAMLQAGPAIPNAANPPRYCARWHELTGDAGWGGALADAFVQAPARPVYVIYPAGVEMLELIDEAMALYPPALRWQITFSTYFTDMPAGMSCALRCCLAGTRAANEARRQSTDLVIDLTQPLGEAPRSRWSEAARGAESGAARLASESISMTSVRRMPAPPKPAVLEAADQVEQPQAPVDKEADFAAAVEFADRQAKARRRNILAMGLVVVALIAAIFIATRMWRQHQSTLPATAPAEVKPDVIEEKQ